VDIFFLESMDLGKAVWACWIIMKMELGSLQVRLSNCLLRAKVSKTVPMQHSKRASDPFKKGLNHGVGQKAGVWDAVFDQ